MAELDGYVGLLEVPTSATPTAVVNANVIASAKEIMASGNYFGTSKAEITIQNLSSDFGSIMGITVEDLKIRDSADPYAFYPQGVIARKDVAYAPGMELGTEIIVSSDIESGYVPEMGIKMMHRFKIGFLNADNALCTIGQPFDKDYPEWDGHIMGSFFNSQTGETDVFTGSDYYFNNYGIFHINGASENSKWAGKLLGRRVRLYDYDGNEIERREDGTYSVDRESSDTNKFIIAGSDPVNNTFTIYMGEIDPAVAERVSTLKVCSGEKGGDYLYLYGEGNITMNGNQIIWGETFDGINDFSDLPEVTGLKVLIGQSSFSEDNLAGTKLPVSEATLQWDNMWMFSNDAWKTANSSSSPKLFLHANGDVKEVEDKYWKQTTQYHVFMYVALPVASPYTPHAPFNRKSLNRPNYDKYWFIYYPNQSEEHTDRTVYSDADITGNWFKISSIKDVRSTDPNFKYQFTITNLPLGAKVGFWVGASTDMTVSEALALPFLPGGGQDAPYARGRA